MAPAPVWVEVVMEEDEVCDAVAEADPTRLGRVSVQKVEKPVDSDECENLPRRGGKSTEEGKENEPEASEVPVEPYAGAQLESEVRTFDPHAQMATAVELAVVGLGAQASTGRKNYGFSLVSPSREKSSANTPAMPRPSWSTQRSRCRSRYRWRRL